MKKGKSLIGAIFIVIGKNKLWVFITMLFFLYSMGRGVALFLEAKRGEFFPLVNLLAINSYPTRYLSGLFYFTMVFLTMFYICATYGRYIENRIIMLPLFHGYTRKQIFRKNSIAIFIAVLGIYFMCLLAFWIVGMPLEILYHTNKALYIQYGAVTAPLSVNNFIIASGYLMLQYITMLPIIALCILINVLIRKRIIAGGVSCFCYLLLHFFDWLSKGKVFFYKENFMRLIIDNEKVSYLYLSGKEYVTGIFICILVTMILLKITERAFVLSDF